MMSTGVAVLAAALALTAFPAQAQVVYGGGAIYAADPGPPDLGIQGGVYVGLASVLPGLRLGGDMELYLPHTRSDTGFGASFESTLNIMGVNANAQYFFLRGGVHAYGLVGMGYTRMSAQLIQNGQTTNEAETNLGVNLGGGVELPVTFGRLYAEGKIVTEHGTRTMAASPFPSPGRAVFGAGIRFGVR
jgi:opacity protein-like surface antigen